MKERASFWRAPDIGDLELLHATYISHSFSRHTHSGYVIGVIEQGVEVFYYRGETHHALPGVDPSLPEVRTGWGNFKSGQERSSQMPVCML